MSNEVIELNCVQVPASGLHTYIHRVNQIPLLTLEEEQSLGHLYQQTGDIAAAHRLVTSHLRYVVRVAKGYAGYGLQVSDLIQEGTVGLMKAVKRFDPSRGVRLVSFAVHWIKAEMHEFILRNWRAVKIATTKAQRKLFFNLRQTKKRLGWFTQEEIHAVAHDLGVKPEEVVQMEQRLNAQDVPFEGFSDDDPASNHLTFAPADTLAAPTPDPAVHLEHTQWQQQSQQALHTAICRLEPRSRDILQKRWLTDEKSVTLQELAKCYKVSIERIRQLEKQAIKYLRLELERELALTDTP